MRVYFLSAEPAALRLDGQYAGTADMFERYAELDLKKGALAELLPRSGRGPLCFFVDEGFFLSPHPFCSTYTSEIERAIYVGGYPERQCEISVIAQKQAAGALITVFRFGEVYAAAEGGRRTLKKLDERFAEAEIEAVDIGGCEYAAVRGRNALALFRGENLACFCGCDDASFGKELAVTVRPETCTRATVTETYSFDGEKFLPSHTETRGSDAPPHAAAVAFFESVLYGGSKRYLCEELKDRADHLKEYLGPFMAAVPPTEAAEAGYGENAVGLVYPKGGGMFEVRYFTAEIADGKVTNVYPADGGR